MDRSGGLPFPLRMFDSAGAVRAETENLVQRTNDPTAHAEIALIRQAGAAIPREALAGMTLYAAAEPCGMCAAAIVWSGVGRLVYALRADRVRARLALPADLVEPGVSGRAVLDATPRGPRVVGPALEAEAELAMFPPRRDARGAPA